VEGFFDGLMGFLSQASERGFIGAQQKHLVQHSSDVGTLLSSLAQAVSVPPAGSGLDLI